MLSGISCALETKDLMIKGWLSQNSLVNVMENEDDAGTRCTGGRLFAAERAVGSHFAYLRKMWST